MPTAPLQPCPFCASIDLAIDHLGSAERPFFTVACEDCEATGPIAKSRTRAAKLWNTRRPPSKGDGGSR